MLSKEEEATMLDTLASGNVLARQYAKQILGNRRTAIFHRVLKDPSKAKDLKVSEHELSQIKAIKFEDKELIRATWAVDEAMWQQYKKLVIRLARKFGSRMGYSEDKVQDLVGTATIAFMKAARGYDDRRYSFGAYLGMSITTELRRHINKNRGLGKANPELIAAFNREREALEKAGLPCTFDDIARAMNLSASDRRRLWGSIQEPISESEAFAEEGSLATVAVAKSSTKIDMELVRAIQMVELSVIERDSWMAKESVRELFPQSGDTMADVAARFNITPQAVSTAAARANLRIAQHLAAKGF